MTTPLQSNFSLINIPSICQGLLSSGIISPDETTIFTQLSQRILAISGEAIGNGSCMIKPYNPPSDSPIKNRLLLIDFTDSGATNSFTFTGADSRMGDPSWVSTGVGGGAVFSIGTRIAALFDKALAKKWFQIMRTIEDQEGCDGRNKIFTKEDLDEASERFTENGGIFVGMDQGSSNFEVLAVSSSLRDLYIKRLPLNPSAPMRSFEQLISLTKCYERTSFGLIMGIDKNAMTEEERKAFFNIHRRITPNLFLNLLCFYKDENGTIIGTEMMYQDGVGRDKGSRVFTNPRTDSAYPLDALNWAKLTPGVKIEGDETLGVPYTGGVSIFNLATADTSPFIQEMIANRDSIQFTPNSVALFLNNRDEMDAD